jgi:competence CoiA-like predicted nuclease
MAQERYCRRCAEHVNCREEARERATALFCPNCDKQIATTFGDFKISAT